MLNKNYFELFNLPIAYDIDLNLLKKHHHALLQQVHPDRFVNSSAQERRLATQYTGYIHEAFDTLKSSVKRAAYLLKLKGVEINFETDTHMSAEFLMQQMAWQEKKIEAVGNAQALNKITSEIEVYRSNVEKALSELLKDFSDKSIVDIKNSVRQLQFIEKSLHRALG